LKACTYAGAIGALLLRQQRQQQNVDSQFYLHVYERATTGFPEHLAARRGWGSG
jgi:hypothetical protein